VESFVENVTRGNVTEVKVVLASVVSALACYQVFLMSVGYGKLRLPFLAPGPASSTHRAVGDSIVVITLVIAFMCVSYFGFEDEGFVHAITGALLVVVLAIKIAVLRWWHGLDRYLPALGLTVFLLFTLTWLTSAGAFLTGD
jgi:hypothetical protein